MKMYRSALRNLIGLMLIALVFLCSLTYYYLKASSEKDKWVIHTYQVLGQTDVIKNSILNIERSYYLITQSRTPILIYRFEQHVSTVKNELSKLRQLTADNKRIQLTINSIEAQLKDRIDVFKDNVYHRGAYPIIFQPKDIILSKIRVLLNLIEKSELNLLRDRDEEAEKSQAIFSNLILLTISSTLLTMFFFITITRIRKQRSNRLEAEIIESKSAYDLLFNKIGEILFSYDLTNQKFIEISDTCKTVLGYDAIEYYENKLLWYKRIHPADRELIDSLLQQLENGDSSVSKFRIIHEDGSIRWVESSVATSKNKVTNVAQADGIIRDITDQKRSELDREKLITELIRQNTVFEQFGYEVSHSLRSPVANIMGLSKILDSIEIEPIEQRDVINHIQESASQLDKKIRNLNMILSVNNENMQEFENIHFDILLREVTDCLYGSLKRKNIKVRGHFSNADWIFSNRGMLYSIFYNMISSGITNRREDAITEIYVKSIIKGDFMEVVFIDNGQIQDAGMGYEKHGLHQHSPNGLMNPHMGLFMVKNQIEALNGTYNVKHYNDMGSEFSMVFPINMTTLSLN
jgi:PAS domain S-box-containing protein